MSDSTAAFTQAQADVKTLTKRPSNEDMLFLYAHFKQASDGDVSGSRPGMLDMVGRAKYDAWAKLKGHSADAARKAYIDKVTALLKTHKQPMAAPQSGRADYPRFAMIDTRWKDNDVYGHVNNVEYYSYFDSVINRYLIREGGLDIHGGPVIGLCVRSECQYHAPLAFPDQVEAGLRVARLGRSSVQYAIGLFREGEDAPAAEGGFVHVFVDRATRRPVPLEGALRAALAALHVPEREEPGS